jgi:hypothetical protein
MKSKIFFLVISLFMIVSCDLYKNLPERKVLLLTNVPAVTVDITPENYKYGQRICLSCEDSEAVIFYTIDGSIPNENNFAGANKGNVYISNVSDLIIKAVAKKNGYSSSILELNYISNADLYLEDSGQGWILKYNDGRLLKCSGSPPKMTSSNNESFSGYSLYEDTFNVNDLKNGKWYDENEEAFVFRNGRVFNSCILINNNTIIYKQDMMLIENGVDGYKNYYSGDAIYYPGVIGTSARGRFIILYDNNIFQYNAGKIVQDNFFLTDSKIVLKNVSTGTIPESGIFKFGNYIYQRLDKDKYEWVINDYLRLNDIVGDWKYSSWTMTFKSNGYYTFKQGGEPATRRYHLYGKYLVLDGIGGSYVYDRSKKTMTFINSGSQLVYIKK